MADFELPGGFDIVIEPWPYGGLDPSDDNRRYLQGLIFAQDKRKENEDANFYSYPLPLIPVMDAHTQEIVRIDRPATGGKGDGLYDQTFNRDIIGHCTASDYVPELLPGGTRKDLKPLNVVQPDGPSFRVTNESLVEWQKWRFRVGFNPREGATIHDVWYDGRSVMYRLAISEMVSILQSSIGIGFNTDCCRRSPTPTLGLPSIANRHLTLATAAEVTLPITCPLAAIVSG